MPGGYLYGFYKPVIGDPVPVKISCDSQGRLKIDPSLLLVNPPLEDVANKGVTSEWLWDHWKNTEAHHAKYTDADSRAAIGNIFGSDGKVDDHMDFDRASITNLSLINFLRAADNLGSLQVYYDAGVLQFLMAGKNTAGTWMGVTIEIYNGSDYETVIVLPVMDAAIETHRAIVNAHHDKYTDNDAQAAVNMVGNLYWSCPGNVFSAGFPDINNIEKQTLGAVIIKEDNVFLMASVNLPHGCTVTKAEVFGNEPASGEIWGLRRVTLLGVVMNDLALANINTEDTSIDNAVIDNANYSYYFYTDSLDTDYQIYGARITYNL